MPLSGEPTAGRIPDPGIRALLSREAHWQAWLDVEAALAGAQAELGLIPPEAADAIARAARLEHLDRRRLEAGLERTAHTLVPLVWELARACGEPAGGYVHWGATTQNVVDTGDALLLRRVHEILLGQIRRLLDSLADLAERSAELVLAGRTHGQHAVPVTFGYKVAVWIDELVRQRERLRALEARVFVATLGGAAGTFASLGAQGPRLQARVAERLGLVPAPVPSRTHRDRQAEYACALGLLAGSAGKVGREIHRLMATDVAEVAEPSPAGTVGSSTMPQKRNPVLCQDIVAGAAHVRALVPLALEAVMTEHEADRTTTIMMRQALEPACALTGDVLERLAVVVAGLELDPGRMRRNLEAGGGLILAEAVMLELGRHLGRQAAHDRVHAVAQAVAREGGDFAERLAADPGIAAHLDRDALARILDPGRYTGLCAEIAREQAARARAPEPS